MKKIIILILSIGMCFALTSCNSSSNSVGGSNESSWSAVLGEDDSSSREPDEDDFSSREIDEDETSSGEMDEADSSSGEIDADGSSSEDSTLDSSEETEIQWVNVTFKQSGQVDIVKRLKKGDILTDIPTPMPKTGYMVEWESIDFTNITVDVTVNAIETAKTYTLVFDANGGSLTQTTIMVTYGQTYNLMTPVHNTKLFVGWKYNDTNVSLSGTWDIDADTAEVILTAEWLNGGWTGNY